MLDLVHRTYEADESFRSLDFMVHTRLWVSHVILQIILGTLVPLAILAATQLWRFSEARRKAMYVTAALLALVGIFAMRWNVVIGASCSPRVSSDTPPTKWNSPPREGLLPAIGLMILPFVIVVALVKLLPPWERRSQQGLEVLPCSQADLDELRQQVRDLTNRISRLEESLAARGGPRSPSGKRSPPLLPDDRWHDSHKFLTPLPSFRFSERAFGIGGRLPAAGHRRNLGVFTRAPFSP